MCFSHLDIDFFKMLPRIKRFLKSPLMLPIIFFGILIVTGTLLLRGATNGSKATLSWTDAFFTATSATCVTGLEVIDTGSYFSRFGHIIILFLIQIGGLGIMTFAGLAIYLWRQRVSLTNRIAVGNSLLHDPTFHIGKFIVRLFVWTFLIELFGAVLLFAQDPNKFTPFSALFHAVSAFCNAGFSLFKNSLMDWKGDWRINIVFIMLIFLGGIGFTVLVELQNFCVQLIKPIRNNLSNKLSWHSKIVLTTSILLVIFGWVAIYLAEFVGYSRIMTTGNPVLTALFQSVTCRTAGFNTLDIAKMTNVSLLIILFLMFIGGAPGSCAGGLKVTTFRVLLSVITSQLRGRRQACIGKFGISEDKIRKAFLLFIFACGIIFIASLVLDITEGGDLPHYQVRGQFLEILFETVSAFSTVGLSTGLTAKLTIFGKWILIGLMFVGRLGPLLFVAALQSFQEPQYYMLPEENLMIG
jgi:trk system potassium uptake protein TrkH